MVSVSARDAIELRMQTDQTSDVTLMTMLYYQC